MSAEHEVETPCPRNLPAPHFLPGSRPEHRDPGFWISRLEDPDEVVLSPEAIEALNSQALKLSPNAAGMGARYAVLTGPADPEVVVSQMREGIDRHRERAESGHRFFLNGDVPDAVFFDGLQTIQQTIQPSRSLNVVARLTDLRCHPTTQGLYEEPGDVDFDLLLCSTLRPGEVVRVLSRHPEGWILVRTPYVAGWIRAEELGPELSDDAASRYLNPDSFVVVTSDRAPVWSDTTRRHQLSAVRIGLRLPLLEGAASGLVRVLAPSTEGLREGFMEADAVHVGFLPLTRRQVVSQAFQQLDDTFGWAGAGGDRDCSRFLMDLFALFGLLLPRNSAFQSRSGSFTIDTSEMSDTERRRALDHALDQGIALVFMPGHIMLLLGRDGDDYFAIHQFSGYRVGCRPGHDVKMSVDRVSVTTLRLGEGSDRRSFMERFTALTVFGAGEGEAQTTNL